MGADNLICLSNTGNRISCYFLFFFFFFYWDCFVLFCFVLRDKEVTDFSTESQSRTVIFEFGYKSPIYRFFSVQQCSAAIKWWTAPKISNDRIVFFSRHLVTGIISSIPMLPQHYYGFVLCVRMFFFFILYTSFSPITVQISILKWLRYRSHFDQLLTKFSITYFMHTQGQRTKKDQN